MSETISTTVKSTNLKHASASGNNVVLDSSGNTSLSGNLAVTGTTTLTGAVELPNDTVDIADLSATGTASSSTYLRGDNAWSTISTQPNDSVAKAWVVFKGDTSNTVADHYNIDSVTDNGTGDYTFTFDTDFANINYCIAGNAGYSFNPNSDLAGSGFPINYFIRNRNVGSCRVQINAGNNGGTLDDANDVNIVWFGDQ